MLVYTIQNKVITLFVEMQHPNPNFHDISLLISWYMLDKNQDIPTIDGKAQFLCLQELLNHLNIPTIELKASNINMGGLSVNKPNLAQIHHSISSSDTRLLYTPIYQARKFFLNFASRHLESFSTRNTCKCTMLELCVVLHRMFEAQDTSGGYSPHWPTIV